MNNGDEFQAFIEESLEALVGLSVVSYYGEQIPSPTDDMMGKVVGRFMGAVADKRELFQAALTSEQRSLFGIYGHRAATLSIRQGSSDLLMQGLAGSAIANYVIPRKRRIEVGLAVFYHCAQQLKLDTVTLFDAAAGYANEPFAEWLRGFGRRTDVTLARYGWRELNTPDGVKFTFSLV